MIRQLLTLARDNPGMSNAHMAAALVDPKGRVLSYGFNQAKTHPLQAKFSKNPHAVYLHAEIDAIKNALKAGHNIEGATMYVARSLKNGKPGLAKPCVGCQKAIIHFGIDQVYWTEPKL